MTKYRLTSAALSELKEATLYYQRKEPGLGISPRRDRRDRRSNPALSARMASVISAIPSLPNPSLSVWSSLSNSSRRDSDHRCDGSAPRSTPLARHDIGFASDL